jgi:hypothetical protein
MRVLDIYLAGHSCPPTLSSRHAKIVPHASDTGRVEIRCGWPECNALLATIHTQYPDEPPPAEGKEGEGDG